MQQGQHSCPKAVYMQRVSSPGAKSGDEIELSLMLPYNTEKLWLQINIKYAKNIVVVIYKSVIIGIIK